MIRKWKKRLTLCVEFIGCNIEVIDAPCLSRVGIKGRVIDERQHVFIIKKENGKRIMVPKKYHVFIINLDGKRIKIEGKDICFRPEERLKKILK